MSRRFRPRRSLRSEMFSFAVALAVPGLIFFAFPLDALFALPDRSGRETEPSCAFVTLTPEEEYKVLSVARAAWQLDRGTSRRMNIDLFADSLPPLPPRAVLGLSARPRVDRWAPPYLPDPLPPTLAAPPPAKIAPQPDADAIVPTFPKQELLKLN